jgi:hypothetical protein
MPGRGSYCYLLRCFKNDFEASQKMILETSKCSNYQTDHSRLFNCTVEHVPNLTSNPPYDLKTACWTACHQQSRNFLWRGCSIRLRKFHPKICHRGTDWEQRCSYSFSLTSTLDVGRQLTPRPGRITPWAWPGTNYTGVWVDPRADMEGCRKSLPHRDSFPGPSRP